MLAKDVMNTRVVSIDPDAEIVQAAKLMDRLRISALPVIDSTDHLVGMVSEGDLLRRSELGTERQRSWLLTFLTSPETLAREFTKTNAKKVRDVMTTKVVTVTAQTPVSEIAAILESKHIKRVPVVADQKVIGIVSRANLIGALASAKPMPSPSKSDAEIRTDLMARAAKQSWSTPHAGDIFVKDGVVEIWGYVLSQEELDATRVLAERTPGVKKVVDHRAVIEIPTLLP